MFGLPPSKNILCLSGVSCISAHVHCLLSSHWAPPRTVWLCLLTPSHQVFVYVDKILLSFSRLNSPGSFNHSSLDRFSSPLTIIVALCWAHSSTSMSLLTGHSTADVASPVLKREGSAPSLDLLEMLFLMQAWRLLAFFAARSPCWLVVSFLSARTPRAFPARLLSSRLASACTGTWGCSSPGGRLCKSLC